MLKSDTRSRHVIFSGGHFQLLDVGFQRTIAQLVADSQLISILTDECNFGYGPETFGQDPCILPPSIADPWGIRQKSQLWAPTRSRASRSALIVSKTSISSSTNDRS